MGSEGSQEHEDFEVKYFGWRRAEFASWLKWVPEIEQMEMFGIGEVDGGVDRLAPIAAACSDTTAIPSDAE